jgi:hypothetical protein
MAPFDARLLDSFDSLFYLRERGNANPIMSSEILIDHRVTFLDFFTSSRVECAFF